MRAGLDVKSAKLEFSCFCTIVVLGSASAYFRPGRTEIHVRRFVLEMRRSKVRGSHALGLEIPEEMRPVR